MLMRSKKLELLLLGVMPARSDNPEVSGAMRG
jgi:hypothetical protein